MNQASQQPQQLQALAPTMTGAAYYQDPQNYYMNEFHFESEMGPAADISTFPPTMAPPLPMDDGATLGGMTMENILSSGFWDSMLVPGTFAFTSFSSLSSEL
jgi:hypothetical protein